MKRKPKVEKPIEPVKPVVKEQTWTEKMKEMIRETNENLRIAALYQEQTAKILEQNNRELTELYNTLQRQKKDREEKAERLQIRKLTHPNFPEIKDRVYTYKELKELQQDYCDTHQWEVSVLHAALKGNEKDVSFYYKGDWTRAKFYSPTLKWKDWKIVVNGRVITDFQREINNLDGRFYCPTIPHLPIPMDPRCWRQILTTFSEQCKS